MGLRIDTSKMRRELDNKKAKIRADVFKPELKTYARKVLQSAMKATPTRNLAKITRAQTNQYAHRINYIPSFHELCDPSLIVKEDGSAWLYLNGVWYAASYRKLPDEAQAAYNELMSERERRMETPMEAFITGRAQARFLYRRSWYEVGMSIGIQMTATSNVKDSQSRRKPEEQPPQGYGQWRGGKRVLSIVIYNPFLETESKHKPFSGKAILASASSLHFAEFRGEIAAKMKRLLLTA